MAGNGVPPHSLFNQENGAPPAQHNQFMPHPPPGVPCGFVPHANDGRHRARNGVDPRGHMGAGPGAPQHFPAYFGAPNMNGWHGAAHHQGPPAQPIHPIVHTQTAKIQDLQRQLTEAREKRRQLEKTLHDSQTSHKERIAERARIYQEQLDKAGRAFQMAEDAKREKELREKMACKRIKLEPIDDDDDGYGQGPSHQPSGSSDPSLQEGSVSSSGPSSGLPDHHLAGQSGQSSGCPSSAQNFLDQQQASNGQEASEYHQISPDALIRLLTSNREALDLYFNLQASCRGSEQNLPENDQPQLSNGQEASEDCHQSPDALICQQPSYLHYAATDLQPDHPEANADVPESGQPAVGSHPDVIADDGSEADNARDDHFQPAVLRDQFQEAGAPEADNLSALLLGQRNDITNGPPIAEEDPEDVLQAADLRDHSLEADDPEFEHSSVPLPGLSDDIPVDRSPVDVTPDGLLQHPDRREPSPEADALELNDEAALQSGAPDVIQNGVAADEASEDHVPHPALRDHSPEADAPQPFQKHAKLEVPHTKDDFKKYNAARRVFAKTMVVPAPLNPTTEEYRQRLQEAKDHRAHTLVAGDNKLPFIECLYDAGNGAIPQCVTQPPKAHQLYMVFETFDDNPPTRAQITARWKQMEASGNEEYFEWIVRAANLHDEHLIQMAKGYVCVKPRAKRARKDKE
ncbi:Protein CBG07802 [Caenorhabditis briggsae]|uniref:Protein CBG07802 n=1 Tax=Caenorhabditis briggsae TaxID=6238 RepID=A8X572_CAEBR|nr:Protein CBG07802 [Caenorhabditis briggsae]CAP27771.1 Protein CBG07802 [Caenorhabditis briggsae]